MWVKIRRPHERDLVAQPLHRRARPEQARAPLPLRRPPEIVGDQAEPLGAVLERVDELARAHRRAGQRAQPGERRRVDPLEGARISARPAVQEPDERALDPQRTAEARVDIAPARSRPSASSPSRRIRQLGVRREAHRRLGVAEDVEPRCAFVQNVRPGASGASPCAASSTSTPS